MGDRHLPAAQVVTRKANAVAALHGGFVMYLSHRVEWVSDAGGVLAADEGGTELANTQPSPRRRDATWPL